MKESTPKRRYASPLRESAAARKRTQVVETAVRLLAERGGDGVSLETVAKAAGVTRLTVYNQFGSRHGLLEAVFDQCARQGGLHRIPELMSLADPLAALDRLVEIFSDFWGTNGALARLHATAVLDAEFGQAIIERNERRRVVLGVLVERMASQGTVQAERMRDLIDLLFALTSYAFFESLRQGRDHEAVCAIIKGCCRSAVFP
jgi:AcrR family transcriptional regulator